MKIFLNRYGCILVGLIPVILYFSSCLLFEINAESSLQIKKLILENVSKATISPVMLVKEYKARILWQCSSLLSITAYLVAILWSCSLLCKCCMSGAQIKRVVVMGLAIVTLTLLQVIHADPNSAMYNAIFSSTYEALKVSHVLSHDFEQKIYLIISLINILAASTPVFILVAVCSSICFADEPTQPDLNFYVDRMGYLKQGVSAGSIILVFGIIHMVAWMQWPQALMDVNDFTKAYLDSVSANSQFWGITFTLLLLSLYFSAAALLKTRAQKAFSAFPTNEDKQKWLKDNGFSISFQKHALQLCMMLSPSLVSSFNSALDLF